MSKHTEFLSIVRVSLWLGVVLISSPAFSEEVIRVSYPAPDTGYTALWAAKDAGFFRKNKVDVELVYIASSPIGLAALLSGEINVLGGAARAVMTANLAGSSDLVLFAGFTRTLPMGLYAIPSIADPAHLRGKHIGVTRFGSTIDFAGRWLLKRWGLDPKKDVALIQVGSIPNMFAALKAQAIQAGLFSPPYTTMAKKAGFCELADIGSMGLKFQKEAFGARRSFLEKNREVMIRFVTALVEAIHFVKEHPDEAISLIRKYTKIEDAEVLKETYETSVKENLPSVPSVTGDNLSLILSDIQEQDPKARNVTPERFIFDGYVKEVVDSGIMQRLYH